MTVNILNSITKMYSCGANVHVKVFDEISPNQTYTNQYVIIRS